MLNNNEFKEYIHSRIDKMLMQDNKYKNLQDNLCNAAKAKDVGSYEELSIEAEIRVQELSYMQGFKDAIEILHGKI